jgi:hypothetical protein
MAIIVASPDLVAAPCQTPRQMLLVNTLCQAWETASTTATWLGILMPGWRL